MTLSNPLPRYRVLPKSFLEKGILNLEMLIKVHIPLKDERQVVMMFHISKVITNNEYPKSQGNIPSDQRCTDHILLQLHIGEREFIYGELSNNVRRCDETPDHGECLLKTHHERQEKRKRSAVREEGTRKRSQASCQYFAVSKTINAPHQPDSEKQNELTHLGDKMSWESDSFAMGWLACKAPSNHSQFRHLQREEFSSPCCGVNSRERFLS